MRLFDSLPKSGQTAHSPQRQSKSSRRKLLLYIEGVAKFGQTAHGPQSARIQEFLQKTPALHLKRSDTVLNDNRKSSRRKLLLYIEGLAKSGQTAHTLQRQPKSSRSKLLLYIESLAKSGQTARGPQSNRIQKLLQKTPALHFERVRHGQTTHSPQSTILVDEFIQITPAVHRVSS